MPLWIIAILIGWALSATAEKGSVRKHEHEHENVPPHSADSAGDDGSRKPGIHPVESGERNEQLKPSESVPSTQGK